MAENGNGVHLIGCHAYAARLHRSRFSDMEPGLPDGYSGEGLINLRRTHENLIGEGLRMISDSYLEPLAKVAIEKGVAYECLTPEGRSYVQILNASRNKQANLMIMGARGQGRADGMGSTAERVLMYSQGMDVLLMRSPIGFEGGSILVGIDGSENSYAAMSRAVELAEALDKKIEAVSVYDPFFHSGIFKSISASLPEKSRDCFDLTSQERIHDDVIDKGLKRLYSEGLKKGVQQAEVRGLKVGSEVLAGKVCPQIQDFVSKRNISLIVLGRFGLHMEQGSMIGSNSLRLARSSTANVLIVSASEDFDNPEGTGISGLVFEAENSCALAFDGANRGGEMPEAEVVIMHKAKRFAPDFHRHMLRGRIQGQIIKAGDRILIYEVDETFPKGPVQVTERTRLEVR